MLQLQENGFSVNFERLLAEIKERDDRDRNRAVAPLVPAADALVLDSTRLSIEQVIEKRYNMRAKNWLSLKCDRICSTPLQRIDSGYVKQPHPARSQVDVKYET